MHFYSALLCYITACDKCAGQPRLMKSRGSLICRTSSSWQFPYFCSFMCNISSQVTWLNTSQTTPLLQNTISVLLEDESRVIPRGGRNLQVLWHCSVLGADDGNMPHGAKPNRDPDSLPATASPDIFRTTSQGQLLGITAWRLGYFAAFCFGVFLTDRCELCGCVPVRSTNNQQGQENNIYLLCVNTHTHLCIACMQNHLDVH